MSPLAVLRIAVRALARNKLRSFLTALGIIIGVAAVIAMVSIGEGAKARVAQTIESMGSNLLVVRGGSSSGGGVRGGFDSQPTLTWDDLDAILSQSYAHPGGAELGIAATAIDAGYLTDMVLAFCAKRFERRIFPTKGMVDGAILQRPASSRASQRARLRAGRGQYRVGTRNAKAALFSRLRITEPGPGFCHFPARYHAEFYEQLTAEKVVTKYRKGFPIVEWVKIRPRNEALDIRILNMAAVTFLNPGWPALAQRAMRSSAPPAEPTPPAPAAPTRPRAPQRKRGGWVKGYK